MQVEINQILYDIPFNLDFPLREFIAYYEQYGRDLDKELEEISNRDYEKLLKEKGWEPTPEDIEMHKQIDLDVHLDNEALAWFSYWVKLDLFEARKQPEIQPLLSYYRILRYLLYDAMEQVIEFPTEIDWQGEVWSIQDFKVSPANEMTFNEIITSKEVMRQVYALGKSKWEAMPYLAAVFFRKKDEPFTDDLVQDGGERMNLMLELPMLFAVQVAFFLSICVNIWNSTSAYSAAEERVTANLNW